MSANGRSPRFLDSLKNLGVKQVMVKQSNSLDEKATEPAASPPAPSPSPLARSLPSIREGEFLPPVSRWMTLGGLFMVATVGIAIVLAGVTRYKTTVKAQASVRPTGELRLVQAATEGAVKTIWVQENQPVNQGDILVTLDDSDLQTRKSQLQSQIQQAILQLAQMNAQIQALNTQIVAETDRTNRAVASAKAEMSRRQRDYRDRQITTVSEVREAEANLSSSQYELNRAEAELKLAQANLRAAEASLRASLKRRDRYETIAEAGAISLEQFEEVQITAERQAQEVEGHQATVESHRQTIERLKQSMRAASARLQRATATLNPTSAEVAIATEQIAREKAAGEVTSATLKRELEVLIQQRIAFQKQLERDRQQLEQVTFDLSKTAITATASGTITRLNLRNAGQTVRSGEEIAQIVPKDASLVIEAAVLPSDIGSLKVGQPVQMLVSACPYPDYGTLKATVSRISQDTIKSTTVNAIAPLAPVDRNAAYYKVTITPQSLIFGKSNYQCTLQLGMEGRADIISREETFLQFLLRKARLITDT
jgi:multidrug efflux pump subunit AcrA (membrane-fusion protein)